MLEAATHVDKKEAKKTTNQKEPTSKNKKLFIHWKYHPHNIDHRTLRKINKETFEGHNGFDTMPVCYSRSKDLMDVLTSTLLDLPIGEIMSGILQSEDNRKPEVKTNELVLRDRTPAKK
jgi:hypothetical protein